MISTVEVYSLFQIPAQKNIFNYMRLFRDSWNYPVILLDLVCRAGFFLCNCGHKMGKCKTPATVVCDITSVNLAYAVLE